MKIIDKIFANPTTGALSMSTKDGQSISTGVIIESKGTGTTMALGVYTDLTSVYLPAGRWELYGMVSNNNAGSNTGWEGAISVNSGNVTTDHTTDNTIYVHHPTGMYGTGNAICIRTFTQPTRVYLKALSTGQAVAATLWVLRAKSV